MRTPRRRPHTATAFFADWRRTPRPLRPKNEDRANASALMHGYTESIREAACAMGVRLRPDMDRWTFRRLLDAADWVSIRERCGRWSQCPCGEVFLLMPHNTDWALEDNDTGFCSDDCRKAENRLPCGGAAQAD